MIKNVSVYVTHNNNQDLDDAKRFLRGDGKIYSFIEGRRNIFHFDTLKREVEQIFKLMNPEDYLLLSGNLVISSFVTAFVYSEFKRIKVLIWNYHNREYVEEVLEFNK